MSYDSCYFEPSLYLTEPSKILHWDIDFPCYVHVAKHIIQLHIFVLPCHSLLLHLVEIHRANKSGRWTVTEECAGAITSFWTSGQTTKDTLPSQCAESPHWCTEHTPGSQTKHGGDWWWCDQIHLWIQRWQWERYIIGI